MPASLPFVVTALGITQIISWGTVYYAISVLAKPMAADLGWSLTFVFLGFSLSLLVGGLVAKPVARFMERRGGRTTLTIGSVLAAAGLALMALVSEPILYFAAWTLLGFASRFTLYDAAFATLVEVFGTGGRRAISILTLFGGLASTILWPIAHYVNEAVGWRGTWVFCAALVLILCTPLHLAMPRFRPEPADGPGEAAHAADPPPLVPPDQRRFAIAMLAIALAMNSFVFTALSAHFIPALTLAGVAAATAVWVASAKGVFQTLGRLWELLFAQKMNPFVLSLIAIGGMPLAFLALAIGGLNLPTLMVFSALYGIANGLVTIVRGGVPLVLFGRQGYASVLASIATPGLVVTAAAPTLFALILDAWGALVGFAILAAISVVAFAATIVLAWRFRRRAE